MVGEIHNLFLFTMFPSRKSGSVPRSTGSETLDKLIYRFILYVHCCKKNKSEVYFFVRSSFSCMPCKLYVCEKISRLLLEKVVIAMRSSEIFARLIFFFLPFFSFSLPHPPRFYDYRSLHTIVADHHLFRADPNRVFRKI
jgi:hypothetical protein